MYFLTPEAKGSLREFIAILGFCCVLVVKLEIHRAAR